MSDEHREPKPPALTDRRTPPWTLAPLLAEFVGTLIVTLGTLAPDALERGLGLHVGYAVRVACTGVATMIVIYAFGEVSGAHVNPVTTLAFAIRRDIPWLRSVAYMVTQFAGAVAAAALVLAILHPDPAALHPLQSLGAWPAFWWEIVLTVILILVALSTAQEGRFIGAQSAIANGATTVFDRWIAAPISGGSMNPARTLGPMLVVGFSSGWWVYLCAPVIGSLLAVGFMGLIHGAPTASERERGSGAET
jgi:aquaporin Z